MKTSASQRSLKTFLDESATSDPRRKALRAVCDRTALWEYSTGRSIPSAARAGEIELATAGAVLANGWIPDEPPATQEGGAS